MEGEGLGSLYENLHMTVLTELLQGTSTAAVWHNEHKLPFDEIKTIIHRNTAAIMFKPAVSKQTALTELEIRVIPIRTHLSTLGFFLSLE